MDLKNTVIIGIDEYNDLKKTKDKIEEGKILVVSETHFQVSYNKTTTYYTESEVVEKLTDKVNSLYDAIKTANEEIKKLEKSLKKEKGRNDDLVKLMDMQIKKESALLNVEEKINKMTIWEFIKRKYNESEGNNQKT